MMSSGPIFVVKADSTETFFRWVASSIRSEVQVEVVLLYTFIKVAISPSPTMHLNPDTPKPPSRSEAIPHSPEDNRFMRH